MDSLYGAVRSLFQEEPPEDGSIDSLVLHAVLFRWCAEHRSTLRNLLREPNWRKRLATFRWTLGESENAAPSSLVVAIRDLLLERRPRPVEQLLVACAAALQILDDYHRDRRAVIERRRIVGLPSPEGARTAFLPPPERPIEKLIPEALARGISDYRADLRDDLKLWWHLVPLERHSVKPCYEELDAAVATTLAERVEAAEKLTIGLASPFSGLEFRIESYPDRRDGEQRTPYRFASLDPAHRKEAREALAKIVETCAAQEVDLLCFPELTLDNDFLKELGQLLAINNASEHPALVVAGSFHREGDKCWHNRSTILDGFGRTLFVQDKCGDFRIPPERAQGMGEAGRRLLGIDERGGYEDIDVGTEIRIVETPLGRLVVPICRDYLDDGIGELLVESGVNLCLVPAMSERMEPFHRRAKYFGTRTRAVSFAVNSAWLLQRFGVEAEKIERELLVMGYLPRRHGLRTAAGPTEKCADLRLFTMRLLLE
jgi:predicted amidohydrolase